MHPENGAYYIGDSSRDVNDENLGVHYEEGFMEGVYLQQSIDILEDDEDNDDDDDDLLDVDQGEFCVSELGFFNVSEIMEDVGGTCESDHMITMQSLMSPISGIIHPSPECQMMGVGSPKSTARTPDLILSYENTHTLICSEGANAENKQFGLFTLDQDKLSDSLSSSPQQRCVSVIEFINEPVFELSDRPASDYNLKRRTTLARQFSVTSKSSSHISQHQVSPNSPPNTPELQFSNTTEHNSTIDEDITNNKDDIDSISNQCLSDQILLSDAIPKEDGKDLEISKKSTSPTTQLKTKRLSLTKLSMKSPVQSNTNVVSEGVGLKRSRTIPGVDDDLREVLSPIDFLDKTDDHEYTPDEETTGQNEDELDSAKLEDTDNMKTHDECNISSIKGDAIEVEPNKQEGVNSQTNSRTTCKLGDLDKQVEERDFVTNREKDEKDSISNEQERATCQMNGDSKTINEFQDLDGQVKDNDLVSSLKKDGKNVSINEENANFKKVLNEENKITSAAYNNVDVCAIKAVCFDTDDDGLRTVKTHFTADKPDKICSESESDISLQLVNPGITQKEVLSNSSICSQDGLHILPSLPAVEPDKESDRTGDQRQDEDTLHRQETDGQFENEENVTVEPRRELQTPKSHCNGEMLMSGCAASDIVPMTVSQSDRERELKDERANIPDGCDHALKPVVSNSCSGNQQKSLQENNEPNQDSNRNIEEHDNHHSNAASVQDSGSRVEECTQNQLKISTGDHIKSNNDANSVVPFTNLHEKHEDQSDISLEHKSLSSDLDMKKSRFENQDHNEGDDNDNSFCQSDTSINSDTKLKDTSLQLQDIESSGSQDILHGPVNNLKTKLDAKYQVPVTTQSLPQNVDDDMLSDGLQMNPVKDNGLGVVKDKDEKRYQHCEEKHQSINENDVCLESMHHEQSAGETYLNHDCPKGFRIKDKEKTVVGMPGDSPITKQAGPQTIDQLGQSKFDNPGSRPTSNQFHKRDSSTYLNSMYKNYGNFRERQQSVHYEDTCSEGNTDDLTYNETDASHDSDDHSFLNTIYKMRDNESCESSDVEIPSTKRLVQPAANMHQVVAEVHVNSEQSWTPKKKVSRSGQKERKHSRKSSLSRRTSINNIQEGQRRPRDQNKESSLDTRKSVFKDMKDKIDILPNYNKMTSNIIPKHSNVTVIYHDVSRRLPELTSLTSNVAKICHDVTEKIPDPNKICHDVIGIIPDLAKVCIDAYKTVPHPSDRGTNRTHFTARPYSQDGIDDLSKSFDVNVRITKDEKSAGTHPDLVQEQESKRFADADTPKSKEETVRNSDTVVSRAVEKAPEDNDDKKNQDGKPKHIDTECDFSNDDKGIDCSSKPASEKQDVPNTGEPEENQIKEQSHSQMDMTAHDTLSVDRSDVLSACFDLESIEDFEEWKKVERRNAIDCGSPVVGRHLDRNSPLMGNLEDFIFPEVARQVDCGSPVVSKQVEIDTPVVVNQVAPDSPDVGKQVGPGSPIVGKQVGPGSPVVGKQDFVLGALVSLSADITIKTAVSVDGEPSRHLSIACIWQICILIHSCQL